MADECLFRPTIGNFDSKDKRVVEDRVTNPTEWHMERVEIGLDAETTIAIIEKNY